MHHYRQLQDRIVRTESALIDCQKMLQELSADIQTDETELATLKGKREQHATPSHQTGLLDLEKRAEATIRVRKLERLNLINIVHRNQTEMEALRAEQKGLLFMDPAYGSKERPN